MRYKCVIPMIVDYEKKELERQQKENEKGEKEEESSIVNAEEEHIDETEINESKNRVYEHYKQMSQVAKETAQDEEETFPKKKKKKKGYKQLTLGQMHGKKRKRESDIKNEMEVKSDNPDFSTPSPSLNIMHASKKVKREVQETSGEWKVPDNPEIITSIR